MHTANNRSIKAAALRKRAEEQFREHAADVMRPLLDRSPEETEQIIHELQVHQIELEIQNQELRRIQAELEASRTRLANLYDFAPVGCPPTTTSLRRQTKARRNVMLFRETSTAGNGCRCLAHRWGANKTWSGQHEQKNSSSIGCRRSAVPATRDASVRSGRKLANQP